MEALAKQIFELFAGFIAGNQILTVSLIMAWLVLKVSREAGKSLVDFMRLRYELRKLERDDQAAALRQQLAMMRVELEAIRDSMLGALWFIVWEACFLTGIVGHKCRKRHCLNTTLGVIHH